MLAIVEGNDGRVRPVAAGGLINPGLAIDIWGVFDEPCLLKWEWADLVWVLGIQACAVAPSKVKAPRTTQAFLDGMPLSTNCRMVRSLLTIWTICAGIRKVARPKPPQAFLPAPEAFRLGLGTDTIYCRNANSAMRDFKVLANAQSSLILADDRRNRDENHDA
jgi:hypothetical protein